MGYIYALKCPITKSLRYIGQTTYPLNERFNAHISTGRYPERQKPPSNLHLWMNSLVKQSLKPEMIVLYNGPNKHLNFMERYFYTILKDYSELLNNEDLSFYDEVDREYSTNLFWEHNLHPKDVAKEARVGCETVTKYTRTDWKIQPAKELLIHRAILRMINP